MSSLVLELQRDAMDRSIRSSDLLRKALVVARKLGLAEFQQWVELELKGYGPELEVPEYRQVTGVVRAWNPYHGWIPITFRDSVHAKALASRAATQSIAEIETLVEGKSDGTFSMPYSPETQRTICRAIKFATEVTLFVYPAELVHILDSIRTVILNWTLTLEEQGVLGANLSFTRDEKDAAGRVVQNINYYFDGTVQNSQFQQAGNDAQFVVSALAEGDLEELRQLIPLLQTLVREKPELGPDLEPQVAMLEAQARAKSPSRRILVETLGTIRNIAEGTTGSLLAGGMQQSLFALLSKLAG